KDGIRDFHVTGVQTCALPIYRFHHRWLTDNRQCRLWQLRGYLLYHRRRAQAANFLVIADREMDRPLTVFEHRHRSESKGDKPLQDRKSGVEGKRGQERGRGGV